jgi:cytochrome P450
MQYRRDMSIDAVTSAGAEPPALPGLPLVGNLVDFWRGPLEMLEGCARRGDVVRLKFPGPPTYYVNHPALIEQVLVGNHRVMLKDRFTQNLGGLLGRGLLTSDGDFWRRQRRLAQPAFHRERIEAYGAEMVGAAERAIAGWTDGERRDAHADATRVTLEIVGRTLFGADLGSHAHDVADALDVVMARFGDWRYAVFPALSRLPLPANRRFERVVARLDEIVYGVIGARRFGHANAKKSDGGEGTDLLSMLLAARDEDGSRMSDQQLRDEVLILFLAGHETTALALTWTWWLLSRHPAADEALAAELREVLGGRSPTVADVPRLRYTSWVVHEALRLYPPAWSMGREAAEDLTLAGYRIPRGAQIWIGQWTIHRDARFFPRPEAFEPERWANDLVKRLHRFAYFPFGGGPRLCIGNAFAMMESTLLLATMAQRFRVRVPDGHRVGLAPAITLRPRNGLPVTVHRRA